MRGAGARGWQYATALAVFAGLGPSAAALPLRELYLGARAQAMGGAFTAVADDEQAIFYNPAGLAGIKGFSANYIAIDLQASTDLILGYRDSKEALNNLSGDSLNVIMGKNVFARGQFAPSFVMPNFGLAIITDGQVAIFAQNEALPQITLGHQTTNGLQAAYGISFGDRRKRGGSELRVGIGAKLLWRRGGYKLLTLEEVLTISEDTFHSVAGSFQQGYGGDVGVQWVKPFTKNFELLAGAAMTDIGDITFGAGIDSIKSNLSLGVAGRFLFPSGQVIVAYDYRHAMDPADWRKKNHVGAELALPLLSIYGGINQVYPTYGAAFDLWLVRVTAYSSAEEFGGLAQQAPVRTYVLKLALKFGM
jgi:hypothetical protein